MANKFIQAFHLAEIAYEGNIPEDVMADIRKLEKPEESRGKTVKKKKLVVPKLSTPSRKEIIDSARFSRPKKIYMLWQLGYTNKEIRKMIRISDSQISAALHSKGAKARKIYKCRILTDGHYVYGTSLINAVNHCGYECRLAEYAETWLQKNNTTAEYGRWRETEIENDNIRN